MAARNNIWKKVWDQLANPKVSEAELEQCLKQVWSNLPVPVFWLLGNLPAQAEFRDIYEKCFQEGRERLRAYLEGLRQKSQAKR